MAFRQDRVVVVHAVESRPAVVRRAAAGHAAAAWRFLIDEHARLGRRALQSRRQSFRGDGDASTWPSCGGLAGMCNGNEGSSAVVSSSVAASI